MDYIVVSLFNIFIWMFNGFLEYNGVLFLLMNNLFIINGNSEWK